MKLMIQKSFQFCRNMGCVQAREKEIQFNLVYRDSADKGGYTATELSTIRQKIDFFLFILYLMVLQDHDVPKGLSGFGPKKFHKNQSRAETTQNIEKCLFYFSLRFPTRIHFTVSKMQIPLHPTLKSLYLFQPILAYRTDLFPRYCSAISYLFGIMGTSLQYRLVL